MNRTIQALVDTANHLAHIQVEGVEDYTGFSNSDKNVGAHLAAIVSADPTNRASISALASLVGNKYRRQTLGLVGPELLAEFRALGKGAKITLEQRAEARNTVVAQPDVHPKFGSRILFSFPFNEAFSVALREHEGRPFHGPDGWKWALQVEKAEAAAAHLKTLGAKIVGTWGMADYVAPAPRAPRKIECKIKGVNAILSFPYDAALVQVVKEFPTRRYAPDQKAWKIPARDLAYAVEALERAGADCSEMRACAEKVAEAARPIGTPNREIEVPKDLVAPLFEYQREGIDFLVKSLEDERLKVYGGASIRGVILGDDMGLGKAQPLTAPVLTPTGYVPMGTLNVGDKVIGSDGKPTTVIGVFPQGPREVYKITFTDGSSAECCDEHLWAVNTAVRKARKSPHKILSLAAIRASLRESNGNLRHYIPMTEPIQFEDKKQSLHPYVMGVFLGDGGLTTATPRLTSADEDLAATVSAFLPEGTTLHKTRDKYGYRLGLRKSEPFSRPNSVVSALRSYGLMGKKSAQKHIPEDYLLGSVTQRLYLLQGLLDTDGYLSKDNVVQFTSVSPALCDGVRFLVQSLGGIARKSSRQGSYTKGAVKIECQVAYTLTISLPALFNPFLLPRKANAYHARTKYQPTRGIVSVEPKGCEPVQCIRVASADHLYLTGECIVTHNTVQSMVAAHLQALEDERIVVVCPASVKTTWAREIDHWLGSDQSVCVVSNGKDKIDPKARWVIINYDLLLAHHDTLEALGFAIIIVDEAHYAKNRSAIRSRLLVGGDVAMPQEPTVEDQATRRERKVVGLTKLATRRVYPMTGTPLLNRPADLFNLLRMIGHPLGRNWRTFGNRYCAPEEVVVSRDPATGRPRRTATQWRGASNVIELRQKIDGVFLQRKKKNVLKDLPPKTRNWNAVAVDLKLYKAVMADYEARRKSGQLQNTEHHLALITEARQACALAKVPATIEEIENALEQDQKVIVFSVTTKVLDRLEKHFKKVCVRIDGSKSQKQRTEAIDAFQSDETKTVFLGQLQAAGTGITLTAAPMVIVNDLDWVPANHLQAEDRAWRIGQKQPVNVRYMLAAGTFDEDLADMLEEKFALIQTFEGDYEGSSLFLDLVARLAAGPQNKTARKITQARMTGQPLDTPALRAS